MTLLAFHNDPKIKEKYLDRIRAHAAADEIVHGIYWEDGKGCAVGCTIHSGKHKNYETKLGIPQVLARLEDSIFEALPNDKSKLWPEKFLNAIPVGADLSLVWPKFAHWLLVDEKDGMLQFAGDRIDVRTAIISIANLFERRAAGETIRNKDTHAAEAASAAESAWEARAWAAARAAWAAEAAAAAWAAWAAEAAWEARAAWAAEAAAAAIRQSEKLLELLAFQRYNKV